MATHTFKISFCILIYFYLSGSLCSKSLNLAIIADWGGLPAFPYKTFVEVAVGREMATFASLFGIDSVFALGDNFYTEGVKNVDDPRFKETFESAFNYESLQVPWLVIAGNHDHYGNVTAQIAYSKKSKRWHFPSLYYKKTFPVPSSNMTLDVVMLDTSYLCGNTDPRHSDNGPPILDTVDKRLREKQWSWIEATLAASKANYLFVCGHFPVYSVGEHGPTQCLVDRLQPLLLKHNVTAYFSGHDHSQQHIHPQKTESIEMDYFITGSCNFIDASKKHKNDIPVNSLLFHWSDQFSLGAFTLVQIDTKHMTVSFVQSSGKYLYSYSKMPRFY